MAEQLVYMAVKNPRDYLYGVGQPQLIAGGSLLIEQATRTIPLRELTADGGSRYGQGSGGLWTGQPEPIKLESPEWRIVLLDGHSAVIFKSRDLAVTFRDAVLNQITTTTGRTDLVNAVISERQEQESVEQWWRRTRYEAVLGATIAEPPQTSLPITPFTHLCSGCGKEPAEDFTADGLPIGLSCRARLRARGGRAAASADVKEPTPNFQPFKTADSLSPNGIYAVLRLDLTPSLVDSVRDLSGLSAYLYQRVTAVSNALTAATEKLRRSGRESTAVCVVDPLQGGTVLCQSSEAMSLVVESFNAIQWEGKAQLCAGIAVSDANIPYPAAVARADSLLASARMKCLEFPFGSIGDGFVQFHRYRDDYVVYDVDSARSQEHDRFGVTTSGFPVRMSQLKSLMSTVKELQDLGLSMAIVELLLDAIHRERTEAITQTKKIVRHLGGDLAKWLNAHATKYTVFPWKRKGKGDWWTDMADILELYSLGFPAAE